jgi:hypothetical protein
MHPDLNPQHPLSRALHALAAESAHPYGFAEFEQRALHRAATLRRRVVARRIAMTAVVLVAAFVVYRGVTPSVPAQQAVTTRLPPIKTPELTHPEVMERWLATLPNEPAVVQVGTRAAVTGLEDRIAQVDDLLNAARVAQPPPGRLLALQQERTRLVGTLVQVRYAEELVDQSL